MKAALQRLTQGLSLTGAGAEAAMQRILDGVALPTQIAGFVTALSAKGVTAVELAGLVRAIRNSSVSFPASSDVLDTCGTGGDGHDTFNISTAAAIVAAASGVRIAKNGNRSASSRCGSADVLEALGVRIDLSPKQSVECLDQLGISFLYAPLYLPAFRHAAVVRRELEVRTIFNYLGPLCNPAQAKFQIIGVAEAGMVPVIAEALVQLGTQRALIFSSDDGLDELSLSAPSRMIEIRNNHTSLSVLQPAELGLNPAPIEDLRGGDPADNAEIIHRVLAGEKGPHRDIVLLNTAAALRIAGEVNDWRAALDRGSRTIDSGAAAALLKKWIGVTQAYIADPREIDSEAP